MKDLRLLLPLRLLFLLVIPEGDLLLSLQSSLPFPVSHHHTVISTEGGALAAAAEKPGSPPSSLGGVEGTRFSTDTASQPVPIADQKIDIREPHLPHI